MNNHWPAFKRWLKATAAGYAILFCAFTLIDEAPKVVDGDTLELQGQRVRIWGVDAPESDQTCTSQFGRPYDCGARATEHLTAFIGNRAVECWVEAKDIYGRNVSICSVNGRDIGDEMVRSGWALDWPQYSKGAYAKQQDEARAAKRGVWQGTFELPWEWRRTKGNTR